MNPCPCGHLGDATVTCRCTPERVAAYRGRISGPLLDRIDLHVEVPRVTHVELARSSSAESSSVVARRVADARDVQVRRQDCANHRLEGAAVLERVRADAASLELLGAAMQRLALSARAFHRVLRVARTIADLAASDEIRVEHVAEAITFRQLDRRVGGAAASFISV
jgi:magnesium chelatase family protein